MSVRDSSKGASDTIDRIADRFESDWKGGARPAIRDYLTVANGDMRILLLVELIKLDWEYRTKSGESPSIDVYLEKFPELNASQNAIDDIFRYGRRFSAERENETHPAPGVYCPHCGHPFDTNKRGDPHISCSACGSSYEVSVNALADAAGSGPQVIGKFCIQKLVGVGSFGAVYRARDTELDRIVALKIPSCGSFPSRGERNRFFREARSAAQLEHPGIVPVFDVGYYRGIPFIVSGFVDGLTLAEALERRRFSPREAALLIEQVARAAHYAHGHQVIHRDIKPTNILLDREGNPHIADFGLARHDATDMVLTLDGQIVGTPAYMSPEQAAGDSSSADQRSDVYSLGVVLYELLVGERPFRGNTRMLLHQVLHQEPRSPRSFNDRIPRDLETICLKAMDKTPARRFATAGELADDLRRFVDSKPIHARPISKLGHLARWCKRNPRTSVLSAVIVGGLIFTAVAALITSIWMADLASSEKLARARANAQSSRRLAESGILKLQRGDAIGLLDLEGSFEPVAANADELHSRALLASSWIEDIEGRLLMLVGDRAPLSDCDFSPDGGVFATCTRDGALQVWDTETGEPLTPPIAHPYKPFRSKVHFSKNGNLVAVVPEYGSKATVWDWKADPPKLVSLDAPGVCRAVDVLSDGTFVGIFDEQIENENSVVRLWDLESNRLFDGPFHVQEIELCDISHDGEHVAVFSRTHTSGFWSRKNKSFVATDTKPHSEESFASDFSPDGRYFATGSFDNRLRVWSVDTGQCVATLQHDEDVRDLAFSPDGKMLASASFDSNVSLWDTNDYRQIGNAFRHDGPVLTVEFDPDGTRLASAGFDGKVRIWSIPDGQLVGGPFDHQNVVASVRFHPRLNQLLSVSKDGSARIWNLQKPNPRVEQLRHPDRVWSVDFSADGRTLAASSENGYAFVWDVPTGKQLHDPIFYGSQLVSARFNPVNAEELMTCHAGKVKFWNISTGTPSRASLEPAQTYRPARWSPNGNYLLIGTDVAGVWLFHLNSDTVSAYQIPHPVAVKDVAFHPDNERFAIAGDDGLVRLFSAVELSEICQPLVHNSSAHAVAFSPDGRLLAAASEDMSIQLWRTDDWQPFGTKILQSAIVQALAFSTDAQTLASASSNGRVQIWDVRTGLPVGRPFKHQAWATSVAFSPDGLLLASGSFDHTACLWRLPAQPADNEIEQLKRRIWVALGARRNARGDIEPLTGSEWRRYRDRAVETRH